MRRLLLIIAACAAVAAADDASASCRNSFLSRSEGTRQVVTLLTGKLTFQEAQKLAAAIAAKQKPPVAWIDGTGKLIATQFGELKVVRPMPVRCDDKPSGVIVVVTFVTVNKPMRRILIRFDPETTVEFDEQT